MDIIILKWKLRTSLKIARAELNDSIKDHVRKSEAIKQSLKTTSHKRSASNSRDYILPSKFVRTGSNSSANKYQ